MHDVENNRRHQEAERGETDAYLKIFEEVCKLQPSANAELCLLQPYFVVSIDGNDELVNVEVRALRDAKRSSMFRTYYNGKYDVTVSRAPNTQKVFKSRKDGLPHAEIAQAIFDVARASLVKEAENDKVAAARQNIRHATLELRQKFGFNYSKPWSIDSKNSSVEFNIQSTPEKIELVLSLLKERGLL